MPVFFWLKNTVGHLILYSAYLSGCKYLWPNMAMVEVCSCRQTGLVQFIFFQLIRNKRVAVFTFYCKFKYFGHIWQCFGSFSCWKTVLARFDNTHKYWQNCYNQQCEDRKIKKIIKFAYYIANKFFSFISSLIKNIS